MVERFMIWATRLGCIRLMIIVAFALVIVGCQENSSGFEVQQGVIARELSEDGVLTKWALAEQTKTISKNDLATHSGSERRGLGYTIAAPPETEYFDLHSVSRLPGIPARIGGSIAENNSREDAITGLATSPRKFHRIGYEAFDLDDEDPIGEYQIDVYADGEVVTTLFFDVKP